MAGIASYPALFDWTAVIADTALLILLSLARCLGYVLMLFLCVYDYGSCLIKLNEKTVSITCVTNELRIQLKCSF